MNHVFTWRRSTVGALLTLAIAAAACGGPDGEAIPPTATGIPDAAPASADPPPVTEAAAEEQEGRDTVSLQPVGPSTTWLTTTAAVPTTAVAAPESPAAGETTTAIEAAAASQTTTTTTDETTTDAAAAASQTTTTAPAETTTTAPAPTTTKAPTAATAVPAVATTTTVVETTTTATAPTTTKAPTATTEAPAPTTTAAPTTTTTAAPVAATTTTAVADDRPVISVPRPGDDVPVRNDFGHRVDPAVFPQVANVIPYERWNSEDFASMPEWAFLNVDPDRPSRTVSGLVPGAWSKPMDLRIGTAVYGAEALIPIHPTPPGVLEVFVVTGIYLDPLDSDHYKRNAEVYQIRVCGVTPETISWGIEWGRHAIVNEDGLYQLIASDPYGEDGTCNGKL